MAGHLLTHLTYLIYLPYLTTKVSLSLRLLVPITGVSGLARLTADSRDCLSSASEVLALTLSTLPFSSTVTDTDTVEPTLPTGGVHCGSIKFTKAPVISPPLDLLLPLPVD